MLYQASRLSVAVFLDTNLVAANYVVIDSLSLPFIAIWFVSHSIGGNE